MQWWRPGIFNMHIIYLFIFSYTIQQYWGTNNLKINIPRKRWQRVTNFISPTCIWLQRQRAGESQNKCSHVPGPLFFCPSVLSCFVSAQTSNSIEFYLLLKKLLCSFSANGAIWELLSSVWPLYLHNSCLSVALTSGGKRRNAERGTLSYAIWPPAFGKNSRLHLSHCFKWSHLKASLLLTCEALVKIQLLEWVSRYV